MATVNRLPFNTGTIAGTVADAGTVAALAQVVADLPIPGLATTLVPGIVSPDGITTKVVNGVISASLGIAQFTADANIGGHKAVMFSSGGGVVIADPTQLDFQFAGISRAGAASGSIIELVVVGQTVVEFSWAWVSGLAIFVGLGGALTQTPPTSGWLQQIGVAVNETSVFIQPFPAVLLS